MTKTDGSSARQYCWTGNPPTYKATTIDINCLYIGRRWYKLAEQCTTGPIPCTQEYYEGQVERNVAEHLRCTPGYFYNQDDTIFVDNANTGYVSPAMYFNKEQFNTMISSRPVVVTDREEFAIGLNRHQDTILHQVGAEAGMCFINIGGSCTSDKLADSATACEGERYKFPCSRSSSSTSSTAEWAWMGPKPLHGMWDPYHFDTAGHDWPAQTYNDCGGTGYGIGTCDNDRVFNGDLTDVDNEYCGIIKYIENSRWALATRDCSDPYNGHGNEGSDKHGIESYGMCVIHPLKRNTIMSWREAQLISNPNTGFSLGEWPSWDRRRLGLDEDHNMLLRTMEAHSGRGFYNPASSHKHFDDHGKNGTTHFICSDMHHLISQPDRLVPPHIKRGVIDTCNQTVAMLNEDFKRRANLEMIEHSRRAAFSTPESAARHIKHIMSQLVDGDNRPVYPPYDASSGSKPPSQKEQQRQRHAEEIAEDPSANLESRLSRWQGGILRGAQRGGAQGAGRLSRYDGGPQEGDLSHRIDPDGNAPRYTDDAQARRMMAIVNGTSRNLDRYHKLRKLQTSTDPSNTGSRFSANPGYTRGNEILPSAQQLLIGDFDGTGTLDLLVHSPAPSDGDCAMRCHQVRPPPPPSNMRHCKITSR